MELEIKLGERLAKVELIAKEKNCVSIKVDGRLYNIDVVEVENGVYSIIDQGKSYNLEMIQGRGQKSYLVNSSKKYYEVDIIDAQARYQMNRSHGSLDHGNEISSPMPGKVVKIPVKVGDILEAGTPVVIVEAMKMQSEYKVVKKSTVVAIMVEEGQTIDGGQVLVVVEPVTE